MSYQPGDEVQWQDPWMVDEVGDAAPWHAGTVVEGPYTDLVSVDTGDSSGPGDKVVVALPPEYVRSAPRLPLEGV